MPMFGAGGGELKDDVVIFELNSEDNCLLVEVTIKESIAEFVDRFVAPKDSMIELVERLKTFEDPETDFVKS
jgi:hypothetical protein